MKAIFIAYNQAYYMEIVELLESNGCRGYTMWEDVSGRGSVDGEPHIGNHAWPTMNNAILTFVDDDKFMSSDEARYTTMKVALSRAASNFFGFEDYVFYHVDKDEHPYFGQTPSLAELSSRS